MRLKFFIYIIVIALIAIQFINVERTNPPVAAEIKAPPDVKKILRNSCYDCHSNETKWPWYSYIAPISWLVEKDVKSGRKHLNFSEWEKLTTKKKDKKREEIWEQISKDEMPLDIYTYMHPNAKLSLLQKNIIKNWLNNSNNFFDY
ncbi:heme-binding domain-containing protein [Melioribacteraceae bacterium 4301-Me]|uniref:heme-binding domain-containing protein n=1 Tax=Pyranulibacter aquaticus TaxID=3163344 RepID=UPI003596BEC4